jgi:hypothetical protein
MVKRKKILYINNLTHLASLSSYYLQIVKKLFNKNKKSLLQRTIKNNRFNPL